MKYIFSVMLCCLGLLVNAQERDDILVIIAGKMISVADFQAAYLRNNPEAGTTREEVEGFLKHFVDSHLLVAEAEAMRLDTLREFRQKMQGLFYLTQVVGERMSDDWKTQFQDKSCVQVAHLFIPLHQHASITEQQRLRTRMDSVYNVISKGADFMQVAKQIDKGRVAIEWLGHNQVLADVETMAFQLAEGELSLPLLSTDGFHLMRCMKAGFTDDTMPVTETKQTMSSGVSQQEYRKGLLIQLLYDKEMREKAQQDVLGLQQFFTENQKRYAWDVPHFKGIVYQSKDKKTHKMIKKLLNKQPMGRWQSVMDDAANQQVFQHAKVSPVRLFVLGEDAQVDELAFGGPKAQPGEEFPFYGILGKAQKKYPDSVRDVENLVRTDYQAHLERQWLDGLRKRYEVTVNEKVLKKLYR